MESVRYIRHPWKEKRITSPAPDIFAESMPMGTSYQDVLSVTGLDGKDFMIFTMGKHRYPPNVETSTAFQRWMVVYVVDGAIWCGKQQLGRGDFVIIPPSVSKNFYTKQEGVLYYWCTTNDENMVHILSMGGYKEEKMMMGHCDRVHEVVAEFEKTIYRPIQYCDLHIYLVGRFAMLVSHLSGNINKMTKASDQMFKSCLNLIDGMQGNISVDYLAQHCYVSRRYLYALFKEYKKMSPNEYIHSVRMRVADEYLTTTDFSLSKIAELIGYADYSHLTRAYTKYYQISPSKRRKLAKSEDTPSAPTRNLDPKDRS